jgi:hypothetical protein
MISVRDQDRRFSTLKTPKLMEVDCDVRRSLKLLDKLAQLTIRSVSDG